MSATTQRAFSRYLLVAGLSLGLGSTAAMADGKLEASGEAIGITCVACHGVNGSGSDPIPSLNNHTKESIVAMMQGYKNDEIPASVMNRHAKGYTDAEIEAVAEYFANLP